MVRYQMTEPETRFTAFMTTSVSVGIRAKQHIHYLAFHDSEVHRGADGSGGGCKVREH